MKIAKNIALGLLTLMAIFGAYQLYRIIVPSTPKKEVSATVLLEKIEKVVKLTTVEGSFSEIYNYKQHNLADLWPFRKKALVRINAKVSVGYDFERLTIEVDEAAKRIIIKNIPEPEILSIEHDLDFYNIENGLFNMITNEDFTEMGFEAKKFIKDKVAETTLFEEAEEQRKELFEMLFLAQRLGEWEIITEKAPKESIAG